jgi:hypothetical protein
MTVEKVVCDECGRVKDHANHWHKIGMANTATGIWIELGAIGGHAEYPTYEVHDLCGEACFYKHIGKMLKLNPVVSE